MKIYHTETQEDYDALMVELEEQGCKWLSGRKPTEVKYHWFNYEEKTCVRVSSGFLTKFEFRHSEEEYPDTPITKYKAKADEKMKFTKENVYKVFSQYRKDSNFPFNDLQDEIIKLDDTPEKVAVPKCFDEWFKEIKVKYPSPDSAKKFALLKLCQRGFGYYFERANDEKISFESELGKWMLENTFLAIDAVLHGYTIEPEKLYYIPLPDLEMLDGTQQVLSKSKNGNRYFASRPDKNLKQRFTKEELKRVPVSYKPYAKPIEEEEE